MINSVVGEYGVIIDKETMISGLELQVQDTQDIFDCTKLLIDNFNKINVLVFQNRIILLIQTVLSEDKEIHVIISELQKFLTQTISKDFGYQLKLITGSQTAALLYLSNSTTRKRNIYKINIDKSEYQYMKSYNVTNLVIRNLDFKVFFRHLDESKHEYLIFSINITKHHQRLEFRMIINLITHDLNKLLNLEKRLISFFQEQSGLEGEMSVIKEKKKQVFSSFTRYGYSKSHVFN